MIPGTNKFFNKSFWLASLLLLAFSYYLVVNAEETISMDSIFNSSQKTKILIKVEDRDFVNDQIIEYRVHDNGLAMKTILHHGDYHEMKLFNTEISQISKSKIKKAKKLLEELRATEFGNSFPWRETLDEKGNTTKIEFASLVSVDCFDHELEKAFNLSITAKAENKKLDQCKLGEMAKTYLYYNKHKQAPKVFRDVLNFVKSL